MARRRPDLTKRTSLKLSPELQWYLSHHEIRTLLDHYHGKTSAKPNKGDIIMLALDEHLDSLGLGENDITADTLERVLEIEHPEPRVQTETSYPLISVQITKRQSLLLKILADTGNIGQGDIMREALASYLESQGYDVDTFPTHMVFTYPDGRVVERPIDRSNFTRS